MEFRPVFTLLMPIAIYLKNGLHTLGECVKTGSRDTSIRRPSTLYMA